MSYKKFKEGFILFYLIEMCMVSNWLDLYNLICFAYILTTIPY
jgi:hypothetical protein